MRRLILGGAASLALVGSGLVLGPPAWSGAAAWSGGAAVWSGPARAARAATPATAAKAAPTQPRPTSTPDAPGIVIARAPIDLPDPFVLDARHTYYLFASTALGHDQLLVPMIHGRPGHWSKPVNVLRSLPGWAETPSAGGKEWAPAVFRFKGRYVMYVAPTATGGNGAVQHCITIATSLRPGGPYTPQPQPLVCDRAEGGDIDAQAFRDPDGPGGRTHPYYLVWKSDNNSTPGDGTPTIWAARLSNDGMRLTGPAVRVYQPTEPWQGNLIEAPQMARAPGGRVWLFYSAGAFTSSGYAMGVASCVGPLGPCRDTSSGPFVASNAQGLGPGEETVFTGSDGSTWLVYNPWYAGNVFQGHLDRPAEALRVGWGSGGPYVAEAGTFPPPGSG